MATIEDAVPLTATVDGNGDDAPEVQTVQVPTPSSASDDVTASDVTHMTSSSDIPQTITGDHVGTPKLAPQPPAQIIYTIIQGNLSTPPSGGVVKRKRGRPPKRPLDTFQPPRGVSILKTSAATGGASGSTSSPDGTPPLKRRRGRPRKSETQKVKNQQVISIVHTGPQQEQGAQKTADGGPHTTPSSETRISRRLAVKRESGYVAPWKALMKTPKEEEDEDEAEDMEEVTKTRPRLNSNTSVKKPTQPKRNSLPQGIQPKSAVTTEVISEDARIIHNIIKKPAETTEEGKNAKAFGQTVACVSKAMVDKLTTDHDLPKLFTRLTKALDIAWFSSEDLTYYLHGDIYALCQAQQVLDKICEGLTLEDGCASLNISLKETLDQIQEDGEVGAEDVDGRGEDLDSGADEAGINEAETNEAVVNETGTESEAPQVEQPAEEPESAEHEEPTALETEGEQEQEQQEEKLVMINPTTGEKYRSVCAIYTNPEMANVACDVCNFVTTEKGLLKHKVRKHPELVFECEICLEKFGVRYDMRRHRLKHFDASGRLKASFEYAFRQRFPQVTGPITLGVLEEQYTGDGPQEEVMAEAKTQETSQAESGEGDGPADGQGDGQANSQEENEQGNTDQDPKDKESINPGEKRSYKDVQKIYMCDECDYQGSTTGLNKHKNTDHPRYLYKCPKCPFVLGDLIDFLKHYTKHDESTQPVQEINIADLGEFCLCIMCGEQGTEDFIRHHVDTQHPREIKCRMCDVTFTSQRLLQNHFRTTHIDLYKSPARPKKSSLHLPRDTTTCPCEVCGRSIRHSWYNQHMKTHNRVTLRCDFCGFETWKRFEMKNHLLIKHGPKQFMCHVCGQTFSYKSAHLSHMKNKHSDVPAVYPCPHCDKTFSVKRFMQTHVKRMHLKEKKFFCDICGRGFFEKIRMKQHREVHQSVEVRQASKQFKCTDCDRSFRDRAKLTQHLNVHTGERPFTCKICQKGFAWKAELTKHEVSKHSEDRPHRCNLCHKAFKFRYKLTAHMITHTRESPHTCRTCGKAFTQSSTLKKHRCRMDLYALPQPHVPRNVSHNLVQIQGEEGQTEEIYIQVEDPEGTATMVSSENLAELAAAQAETSDDSVTFMCGMCEQLFSTVDAINEHVVNEHGESVTLVMESDSTEQLVTEGQDEETSAVTTISDHMVNEQGEPVTLVMASESPEQLAVKEETEGAALGEIHLQQVEAGQEQNVVEGELYVQEEQEAQCHEQLVVAAGEHEQLQHQEVLIIQPADSDEQVVALHSAMEGQEVVTHHAQILTQEEMVEGAAHGQEEQQTMAIQVVDIGGEQHMSDSQEEQVTIQLSLDPTQQVTVIETEPPADTVVE